MKEKSSGTSTRSTTSGIFNGDRRALARAISLCEREPAAILDTVRRAYAAGCQAHRIGITGAPGSGKSTLTDKLISEYRRRGSRVAVVAIDPTSPYSGGSLLGDRVRMGSHAGDPSVFIRSMATGGRLGGLNASAEAVAVLLTADGFDPVIFETVGVGQSEVDVVELTDSVVLVTAPGFGDGVQAEKAGVMEVGDVFVVNKADLAGAKEVSRTLTNMISQGPHRAWTPPVVETSAERGEGVGILVEALDSHLEYLVKSGTRRSRLKSRAKAELIRVVERMVVEHLDAQTDHLAEEVASGRLDPWTAASRLKAALINTDRPDG